MSSIWVNVVNIVITGIEYLDVLGRWNSITIEGREKKLMIITMYRVPSNWSKWIFTSKYHHDREITTRDIACYRSEVLESITNYIRNYSEVDDILFFWDMNEDISLNVIERFMNGLFDACDYINYNNKTILEKTHVNRSRCIYIYAGTEGVLKHVNWCEMIDFYETLQSDYRRCVIDINVKTYFKMKVDKFDDNSIIKLDPRRLSHVEKFKRKLENLLETMNLEDSIETIIKQGVTHEYLDRID